MSWIEMEVVLEKKMDIYDNTDTEMKWTVFNTLGTSLKEFFSIIQNLT